MTKKPSEKKDAKTKYYKHPQYGMVFGVDIKTPVGRLTWPSLVEPKPGFEDPATKIIGAARYEATVSFKKDSKDFLAFHKLVEDMTKEMLPIYNEGKKARLSDLELFKDGDSFDQEKMPYYGGMWNLKATNAKEVQVLLLEKDARGEWVEGEPRQLVAGMLVRCVVRPLITAHGLSYKLQTIQLCLDDGVRYGGANQKSSSLFDDSPEDFLSSLEETSSPSSLDEAMDRI